MTATQAKKIHDKIADAIRDAKRVQSAINAYIECEEWDMAKHCAYALIPVLERLRDATNELADAED